MQARSFRFPPGAALLGVLTMPRYHHYSRSAYYGAVAALPLLAAYEALLYLARTPAQFQVRNVADVWLRTLMASLGATPAQATLAMLLILLLAVPLMRRREAPLVAGYFVWMLLEAIAYSLALFVISALVPPLPMGLPAALPPAAMWPAAMPPGIGLTEGIALSLGAGLFEEFAFRVALVTVLLWATRQVFANWLGVTLSILAAAFLFSLAHYLGPFGEPFSTESFLFRWAAGLVFTLLYYARGFAVTAYTHALYDLWVLVV